VVTVKRNVVKRLAWIATVAATWIIATPAVAASLPAVTMGFTPGATPHEQILHVEADFGAIGSDLCGVLCDLTRYPALHPWIVGSRLLTLDPDNDTQEVLVTLDLPWPAGHQWARLKVERFGRWTLAWRQIEGSFEKLNGTLVIGSQAGHVHLSYWAVIDLGLPNIATRPVLMHFARGFLRTAYQAAMRRAMQRLAQPSTAVHVAMGK